MTSRQCVKVSELRKMGYTDFEDCVGTTDNVYVGRRGRIWIHGENKRMYHFKGTKWGKPF
jgi:hypothetical protein